MIWTFQVSLCLINVVILSVAGLTLVQRQCQMEAEMLSRRTTSSHMTSNREQNVAPINRVRPLFPGRRRRFASMVPKPRTEETRSPELVQDRSTCPWTLVLDYNRTRIPRSMYRAVCLHNQGDNSCDDSFISLNRSNPIVRNVLDLAHVETECALAYHKLWVIAECCENGNYERRWESVEWPVACTCARKRIVTVTPANTNKK